MMKSKIDELESMVPFKDLWKMGVRVGDIIAVPLGENDCGIAWQYTLLRNGFPEYWDTSLVTYKDPRDPKRMFFAQIGFHWCGSTDFGCRIATEGEKKDFIDCCVEMLKKPRVNEWGWFDDTYKAQILYNMKRDGLISRHVAARINKDMLALHGIDLLKTYKANFG